MIDQNKLPTMTLVAGPVSVALPCVSLSFETAQKEFPVFLLSDRSVFVPAWLDGPLAFAATVHARQFEKDHRIVIHELFKCARQEIRPNVSRRVGSSIANKPTLSRAKELVFQMNLQDTDVILHISPKLAPCQIYLANGDDCDSKCLFEAYDLALEYMQIHVEELEEMGFDTSILRLSVQDWLGYRERFRVVGVIDEATRT